MFRQAHLTWPSAVPDVKGHCQLFERFYGILRGEVLAFFLNHFTVPEFKGFQQAGCRRKGCGTTARMLHIWMVVSQAACIFFPKNLKGSLIEFCRQELIEIALA